MKPLFLYTGPEFGERNDTIDDFRKQIEKKLGSLDYHRLYTSDVKVQDVITLLRSGSLFEDGRFVVLYNAETIKNKDDINELNLWQNACEKNGKNDAFLFLVSDDIGVDKKLENIVDKANKKIFWEMFDNRKEQWLHSFFSKNGYSIEQAAVERILEMIENNTEALRNECSRFFLCFEKGYVITTEDVENVLTHNREESAFTLFDVACEPSRNDVQRFESALSVLQKIMQSKDSESIALIAGLTYCFRTLRTWHEIHENSHPTEFDLKKAGFLSKTKQNQYNAASQLWNSVQTSHCLARLAESDIKIRSIGGAVVENVLQTMLYSIILKKGEPIQEAPLCSEGL
ncbi:MAG: DNA polymerase III subunit delta [Treponema sp.]|nr:DNA polymerase III subunit delta [Treponema sp.]